MPEQDIYTTADLARHLGVTSETILRWARTGRLPEPVQLRANMYIWPAGLVGKAVGQILAERGGEQRSCHGDEEGMP